MELGTRILFPALQRQAATAHYHQLVAEGKVVQTGKKRPSPAPLTAEGQESLPSPALQTKKIAANAVRSRRSWCGLAIQIQTDFPPPILWRRRRVQFRYTHFGRRGGQGASPWHTAFLARYSVLCLLARLTGEAGGGAVCVPSPVPRLPLAGQSVLK